MGKKSRRIKPIRIRGHNLKALRTARGIFHTNYIYICECGSISEESKPSIHDAREDHLRHIFLIESTTLNKRSN